MIFLDLMLGAFGLFIVGAVVACLVMMVIGIKQTIDE